MPLTADTERRLLNHYKLTTLYPSTWPHQPGDDSSDSDSDPEPKPNGNKTPSSKSPAPSPLVGRQSSSARFRQIDRHASIRSASSLLGSSSVINQDEPDALGQIQSIAITLRSRGLRVEEDLALRNRFMLSSTSFSPALYLSQVHSEASTEDLLRGLEFLGRSIEQKSASLKVLVESNFEKFVRAKGTIDNVYLEMRTQGVEPGSPSSPNLALTPGRRPHSRHTSRGGAGGGSGTHFRSTSNTFSSFSPTLGGNSRSATTPARKNALTREAEYGVLGIKAPLTDVVMRAEEVWGPALGGREKEENLKVLRGTLEQHAEIFRLGSVVSEAIKQNDYDGVVAGWKKVLFLVEIAKGIASTVQRTGGEMGDADAQYILLVSHAYHDVSTQLDVFKRSLWQRLKTTHGRSKPGNVARSTALSEEMEDREVHMDLIAVLLQLGVDENPIWEWLNSRCLYLKDKIARGFERSRIEIEILRRRLAGVNAKQGKDGRALGRYLRASSAGGGVGSGEKAMDGVGIVAFWEKVLNALRGLLGSTGIVGEVMDFWAATQSFIDGRAQKAFPAAVLNANSEHLELEPDDVANLRSGALDLVSQLRESIMSFFADAPVDDLSDLYSPIPPTPITPDSGNKTPGGGGVRRAFTFGGAGHAELPPPSPKTGEWWEKFAFWPPGGNALGGAHYLALLLSLIGTAASELAGLSVVRQRGTTTSGPEGLKLLVSGVRERGIHALCSAWAADADRLRDLEGWVRCSSERRDLTLMPGLFMVFEERVLEGFRGIAYVGEGGVEGVVQPPPAKLLQAVRGAFVGGLYKGLSGMVENAEKGRVGSGGGKDGGLDGVVLEVGDGEGVEGGAGRVDASNKNVRILMTLSNLSHLRSEIIPHLISAFESSFSVKLTEETKTIRDVLGQIDARLFQAYVKGTVDKLSILIHDGINSTTWAPASGRPVNAKNYVYDVLNALVLVHSEVSTTATGMTNQILSYLLEQSSINLLESFKKAHTHYSLPALMQATLDVEFLAQTLNNYTTERASEVQSQIYLALDERTDDDARKRLQGELPEMRAVLKKLREGTKLQFGCFKRERRGREGRGGVAASGSAAGGGGGRS
ncbi:Exocyst complex component S5 [Elasticomyces elasticus]|nr:Exocyst complex component S5 [Elasticomyces elasticus]KAK3630211.1 Exocyst complex component S5 [Elasticomyces elasticus]KAK4920162.1 Exocyst complex component S5 [Elasticomyces elasticus]KAK5748942.1 Exocyst complex component S5 [Elasticomyces elasticus]